MIKHVNDSTFPHELKDEIAKLGLNGFHLTDFGGPGLSLHTIGAFGYEAAKIDVSIGTFIALHNCLGLQSIDLLGSDEQRERFIPDALTFKKILGFALTEPEYGSDATSLKTSAKKVPGGYLLNGKKRWIGNATFDNSVVIVWARNEEEGGKI